MEFYAAAENEEPERDELNTCPVKSSKPISQSHHICNKCNSDSSLFCPVALQPFAWPQRETRTKHVSQTHQTESPPANEIPSHHKSFDLTWINLGRSGCLIVFLPRHFHLLFPRSVSESMVVGNTCCERQTVPLCRGEMCNMRSRQQGSSSIFKVVLNRWPPSSPLGPTPSTAVQLMSAATLRHSLLRQ